MFIPNLRPIYGDSYALVIGINKYASASPLGYAVSDATAVAETLIKYIGFPEHNVRVLLDVEATRATIMQTFLAYTMSGTEVNDRFIFFFAGHGHTVTSLKSEVGFLVPCDGIVDDLSTLVRWDEPTRNADLIRAKHILFLMDACYGGLAITRTIKPGAMRFAKDMLLRPSRQVLTAGKADEVVADLGGPLPNHSIFTGHLLEALVGKAMDGDGLLTANGVMAYVYGLVGRDAGSRQTPHFGYLDGDGDLILSSLKFLEETEGAEKTGKDILISVPAVVANQGEGMTVVDHAKELLTDEKYRIRLYELVVGQTREVMALTAEDNFPNQGAWSNEDFVKRLNKYQEVTTDLRSIQALMGFWGTEAHSGTLVLPIKQIAGRLTAGSGLLIWLALRWYPVLLLLYCGGIAAVAAARYDNLRSLMHATVADPERIHKKNKLVLNLGASSELENAFKTLPGYERNYVPRSEYLFKFLQPELDEVLFLGFDYEWYFDEFEVLLALEHAEQSQSLGLPVWGPVGRFGWKYRSVGESSPLHRIVAQAKELGEEWPPVKAGLFRGSITRFNEIAASFLESVAKFGWY